MQYPETKLWELLKSLKSSTVQIFKEHQDVDNDKKPKKYIVIQDQVYDSPEIFGDGKALLREATFEIYVNALKKADVKTLYTQIIEKLNEAEISFNLVGNVYDNSSQYYTMTLEGNIVYA